MGLLTMTVDEMKMVVVNDGIGGRILRDWGLSTLVNNKEN